MKKICIYQEPVQNKDDLIRFHEESGLPVALDETLDDFEECPLRMLTKYAHPGIVAVVSPWSFFYIIYMSLRLSKHILFLV